jgi:hypothetical protein
MWMAPALEVSIALFIAACTVFAVDALLRLGLLAHTAAERSWVALWPRLAIAQLVLFATIEHSEGTHAGLLGCAIQVLVALIAAYILYAFAHLLVRCARGAQAASRYLERIRRSIISFVSRRPASAAYALAVHAGRSRFQRPPPQNVAVF